MTITKIFRLIINLQLEFQIHKSNINKKSSIKHNKDLMKFLINNKLLKIYKKIDHILSISSRKI